MVTHDMCIYKKQVIVTFGGRGGGISSAGMMRLLAERVLV